MRRLASIALAAVILTAFVAAGLSHIGRATAQAKRPYEGTTIRAVVNAELRNLSRTISASLTGDAFSPLVQVFNSRRK